MELVFTGHAWKGMNTYIAAADQCRLQGT